MDQWDVVMVDQGGGYSGSVGCGHGGSGGRLKWISGMWSWWIRGEVIVGQWDEVMVDQGGG